MNDTTKAALINLQAALMQAEIAGMQVANARELSYNQAAFEDCAERHFKTVQAIIQKPPQGESKEGPFRFGVDPPPKGGVSRVHWWHSDTWHSLEVHLLSNGDIWSYQPPRPEELLG